MNTLTLCPDKNSLSYAFFHGNARKPVISAELEHFMNASNDFRTVQEKLRIVRDSCRDVSTSGGPRLIAIRILFGGDKFLRPTMVNPDVIRALEGIAHLAPLHLPMQIALIRACQEQFPEVPIVLAFETSFFSALPAREYLYGLDASMMESMEFRRYGFHGLIHHPACVEATRRWRAAGNSGLPKIISFCLERGCEIAAAIGQNPLMVTGGMTPLEGLPGERTCGEIDPSIPLCLAADLKCGPEQIDQLLTKESGMLALSGRPVTLQEVFTSDDPALAFTREFMKYRFLLACGQGIAAMGGVDAIVFSGRYAELGKVIGPWICQTLEKGNPQGSGRLKWIQYKESIFRILADLSVSAAASEPPQVICAVA